MPAHIPESVTLFIEDLVSLQPPPASVWLIGSRANDRANDESDTDILVFGSRALLESARSHLKRLEGVDCLIVFNGDDYKDPWQDKSGSLTKLEWKEGDAGLAQYVGLKWISDEESSDEFNADMGQLLKLNECAVRIWPVSA